MVVWIDPYRFASGGGGDTLPVTANLVAWYDASDTATITSDGSGNVSQWDDKSGNGYHVAQGTSGNQPNDSRATINSLTAIDFDGTTEHLTAFGIIGGGDVPFDSEYTVFMVVVVNSISNFDMLWALESSSPARRARSYMGTSQIELQNWQSVLTNGSIKHYALPSTATTYIFTWKHSGTNASASLRRNGATLTATANPYANDIGTGSAPARISIGSDTGGNYADMTVGEIVYYEAALGSTDTDSVESYLADKWGVTL